MQTHDNRMRPVSQRLATLDILRGFALLGVFLINMLLFSGTDPFEPMQWYGADRVVLWLVVVLVEGKFYPIFAFLFGVGFALQARRASQRSPRFASFYGRRLAVLLLIGILHTVLLSPYDFLVEYALIGALLFPLRTIKPAMLLLLALGVLGASVVLVLLHSAHIVPDSLCDVGCQAHVLAAYNNGSFIEVVALRLHHGLCDLIELPVSLFPYRILGMFLIGAWAGSIGLFHRVAAFAGLFRVAIGVGIVLGVGGMLSFKVKNCVGDIALACCYVSVVSLLLLRPRWEQRLMPVAAMGQMALSNYVLHSLISSILFYGYGFGLIGQIGPAGVVGMALACYLLQMMGSRLWLRHFRRGPLEALWRKLSYPRAD